MFGQMISELSEREEPWAWTWEDEDMASHAKGATAKAERWQRQVGIQDKIARTVCLPDG